MKKVIPFALVTVVYIAIASDIFHQARAACTEAAYIPHALSILVFSVRVDSAESILLRRLRADPLSIWTSTACLPWTAICR